MGERAEKARDMFLQGYNCAQAVVGAFAEDFGCDPILAMRLAEGLGAGLGRLRLTCGAVAAMGMLASLKMSEGIPGDLKTRGEIYAVIQRMTADFKAENGSVICAELLGMTAPKDASPNPEPRTPEYYKRRPCSDKVYQCGLLVEKYLLGEE